MLLHIVARGKIARTPEEALVSRYAARITWPLKLTELPDAGGNPPRLLTPARVVLLDERGEDLASAALARRLEGWRDGGIRECRFVIGAADGHGAAERDGADLLLSFGRATWPHLMVRAMLLEQLFRCCAILAGHPYHRAG